MFSLDKFLRLVTFFSLVTLALNSRPCWSMLLTDTKLNETEEIVLDPNRRRLLAGRQDMFEGDETSTLPGNFSINAFEVYLLMMAIIQSGEVYKIFLEVFAILSVTINTIVVTSLLYNLKLKVRTRHVIFINFCFTEMMSALWEVFKDDAIIEVRGGSYAMLVPVIFLQSASSLTVVMMVALGADTYFAIKKPLRYMSICGRSCKVGVLVVVVSWIIMCFIWTLINSLQSIFSRSHGMSAIITVNLATEVATVAIMIFILSAATFLQCRILLEVRSKVAPDPNLRRSSATLTTSSMSQLTRKAFVFTMGIILISIIFWMPYSVYRLMFSVEIMTTTVMIDYENHIVAFQVLHIIYSLNTFLIPALYAFRIRNPFKSLYTMVTDVYGKIRHRNCHNGDRSDACLEHQQQHRQQCRPKRTTAIRRAPANRSLREGPVTDLASRRVRTVSEPTVVDCGHCGSVFAVSASIRVVPIRPDTNTAENCHETPSSESSSTVITDISFEPTGDNNNEHSSAVVNFCSHNQRHDVVAEMPSVFSVASSNTESSISDYSGYINPWADFGAEEIFYI